MLIKYTGPKPIKKLSWHTKDWGVQEYVFDPVCKVTDSEFCKFLLHPERKGLFVMTDEDPAMKIDSSNQNTSSDSTETIEKEIVLDKPKRGRKPKKQDSYDVSGG